MCYYRAAKCPGDGELLFVNNSAIGKRNHVHSGMFVFWVGHPRRRGKEVMCVYITLSSDPILYSITP